MISKDNLKTIFLFVNKPLFTADLLKGDYLKHLSSGFRVIIFTNKFNQEAAIAEGFFQSPQIIYIKWQPESAKLLSFFKFLRFVCIREFDYLAATKFTRQKFQKDRRIKLLRLLTWPISFFLTAAFFNRLEYLLILRSRCFAEYCQKYRPALLATSTPGINPFEAEAIYQAKKFGIPTAAVNFSWDNLTSRATRIRRVDYLFVWNEPIRMEAIKIHKYDPARVWITGAIRFDKYFKKDFIPVDRSAFLLSKNLNPELKTILYATRSSLPFERMFVENLIRLRNQGLIPYSNILVRVHPLANPDFYREFSVNKDVCIDVLKKMMGQKDAHNLRHSLENTDLIINFASTISLEAILFDKPVINYSGEPKFNNFELEYYRPLLEYKAVRLVKNEAELIGAIKEYLENPALDRENRKKIAEMYFPFRDGLCCQRNVDLLAKII